MPTRPETLRATRQNLEHIRRPVLLHGFPNVFFLYTWAAVPCTNMQSLPASPAASGCYWNPSDSEQRQKVTRTCCLKVPALSGNSQQAPWEQHVHRQPDFLGGRMKNTPDDTIVPCGYMNYLLKKKEQCNR